MFQTADYLEFNLQSSPVWKQPCDCLIEFLYQINLINLNSTTLNEIFIWVINHKFSHLSYNLSVLFSIKVRWTLSQHLSSGHNWNTGKDFSSCKQWVQRVIEHWLMTIRMRKPLDIHCTGSVYANIIHDVYQVPISTSLRLLFKPRTAKQIVKLNPPFNEDCRGF